MTALPALAVADKPRGKPGGTRSLADDTAPQAGPARIARRASKEFRRLQLINATIDSLAVRGYAATTLADVADGAGLSRGIVNFHFESKDRLLVETLNHISEEYTYNWKKALELAGAGAADRLHALICADLDESICSDRQVAAWFAFFAEAKTRPAYQQMCWARDDDYLETLHEICIAIVKEGGYAAEPRKLADAIYAMQEGLWLRLMIERQNFTREVALGTALSAIGALCPKHFEPDGKPRARR
jgi:AcrR family transcriptional regulator